MSLICDFIRCSKVLRLILFEKHCSFHIDLVKKSSSSPLNDFLGCAQPVWTFLAAFQSFLVIFVLYFHLIFQIEHHHYSFRYSWMLSILFCKHFAPYIHSKNVRSKHFPIPWKKSHIRCYYNHKTIAYGNYYMFRMLKKE